jgi:hypothetical protein
VDSARSGLGPVAGFCKHGNESFSSMKGGKFLEKLSHDQLWKNDFVHEVSYME